MKKCVSNEHVNKCSILLIIKDIQIKAIILYIIVHYFVLKFYRNLKKVHTQYWPANKKITLLTQCRNMLLLLFSHSVVSDSLWPNGLQHTRLPCPSPAPKAYSNSCPVSQWCHPTILSSAVLFSSCLQSFPASGSFQMSLFFASGGQSIGVSASVLPMNIFVIVVFQILNFLFCIGV